MESKDKSFNLGERYQAVKQIGKGAYGIVQECIDKTTGEKVAIKRLNKIEDIVTLINTDAKRNLREIRILRYMQHENILILKNVLYDDSNQLNEFGDIYLVTNYMEIDLYKVIRSKQDLTDDHRQYIIYQILRALKYLHSANIIHRDLKPSNILATESCEVRMCDFGLARNIEEDGDEGLTEYVVTRYYRSPEIMLSSHDYNKPVDIWAVGCTFAELITGKILFEGNNYIKLIQLIFEKLGFGQNYLTLKILLGKPAEEDLKFITNENAKKYIKTLPEIPSQKMSSFIKYENNNALDLIDKMLVINPSKRITAEEALNHPYFDDLHNEEDEPVFKGQLDFKFEYDQKMTLEEMRIEILKEINYFKEINKEPTINIEKQMAAVKQRSIKLKSLKKEKQLK